MTTTTENPALDDVELAYTKRRDLAERLAQQDAYIGQVVRTARKNGATWVAIAARARTSDVAAMKAARRLPPEKKKR